MEDYRPPLPHNGKHYANEILRDQIERFNLKCWGFVILRCTYKSQADWETFISILRQHAQEGLESENSDDLIESMTWTVIDDPNTLNDASLLQASQVFQEWRSSEEVKREMKGSKLTQEWHSTPRYCMFIYADEESVESVESVINSDDESREGNGYFFKLVYEDMVMSDQQERITKIREKEERIKRRETGVYGFAQSRERDDLADLMDDDEDDDEETWDLMKKFKADHIVGLYTSLTSLDSWYNFYVDDDGIATTHY